MVAPLVAGDAGLASVAAGEVGKCRSCVFVADMVVDRCGLCRFGPRLDGCEGAVCELIEAAEDAVGDSAVGGFSEVELVSV